MDSQYWKSLLSNYITQQQRLIWGTFAFLAVVNAFAIRNSFDVMLTRAPAKPLDAFLDTKVVKQQISQRIGSDKPFKYFKKVLEYTPREQRIRKAFQLDNMPDLLRIMTMVSFYIGYALAQIPGSLLADRYGSKLILGSCLASTALLSITTPYIVENFGTHGLIVMRTCVGLSEGPLLPALTSMLIEKIPQCQRGTFVTFVLSAGNLGILISNFLSGFLMPHYDWSILFYIIGICCLVWLISFVIYCHKCPGEATCRPEMKIKMKTKLNQSNNERSSDSCTTSLENVGGTTNANLSVPWRGILSNSSVWALIIANIQHDWYQLALNTDTANMLSCWNETDSIDKMSRHYKTALPYILNWLIAIAAGILSDILINNDILDKTEVRRIMTMLSAFGPKVCSNFVSCLLATEGHDFFSVMNCAISTMGACYAGTMLTAIDLSPNYAGTLVALGSTFGSLVNVLQPFAQDILSDLKPLKGLRSFIWLLCTLFTSGDQQYFHGPIIAFQTT